MKPTVLCVLFVLSVKVLLAGESRMPIEKGEPDKRARYLDIYFKNRKAFGNARSVTGYLPLTGGTLTGTLYGTTAGFTGTIHAYLIGANIRLHADGTDNNDGFVGTNSDGTIYMTNWSNNRGLVIHPNGNTLFKDGGLGAAMASYKLEVHTANQNGFRLLTTGSTKANPMIDLYDAGTGQETVLTSTDGDIVGTYLASYSNTPLMLATNHATSQVILRPNGYFGIGTTTPQSKLHLNESSINKDAYFKLTNVASGGTETDGLTLSANYDGGVSLWNYENGYIRFGANNLEKVRITADGNMGIGTSVPGEKLSVNGNIRSKKVIVSQTGWPDYVFEPSYQLRTISEVENFIQKNKRLPDVPSVKEVEANGLNVGDTQALLLKKIEELTLYLIAQQKEIDELKRELKKQ